MPVQLRRERLRRQMIDEIIAAGRLLLEKDGPGAISVRAIARQVGVSAPAIYRYFPSLDALSSALEESVIGELCAAVDSARDRPGDMALAFRGWALDHPASFRFILGLNGGADGRKLTGRLARTSSAPAAAPADGRPARRSGAPAAAPAEGRPAQASSASAAAPAEGRPAQPSSASAAMLGWATLCGLALLELACDPADLPEDIGWLYQTAAAQLAR